MKRKELATKVATSAATVPPPRAPAHLSAASRRVWRAVVSEWEMTPDALLLLQAALEMWELYQRARRELARASALTATSATTGVAHGHPVAKIAADSLREARQCFRQLGLQLPDDGGGRANVTKGVLYDD